MEGVSYSMAGDCAMEPSEGWDWAGGCADV